METFIIKSKSLYKCASCDKQSEINLRPSLYKLLLVVQVAAIVTFAAAMFLGGNYSAFGLVMILSIFGCFYAVSPYFVFLEELSYVKKRRGTFGRLASRVRRWKFDRARKKEEEQRKKEVKRIKENLKENDPKEQIPREGEDDDDREIFSS